MGLYDTVSFEASRIIMQRYSTSFSRSTRLFPVTIRRYIYAVYGLVRIADEIVDGYDGNDKDLVLDSLEQDVYRALDSGYSTNPVVHAFALTAKKFHIDKTLIEPFFSSMRMDLELIHYTPKLYETYIYGSAEVVGLMCLKVFVSNNQDLYRELESDARKLGAAYQKINFLRDLAADNQELGRFYFPGYTFDSFDEAAKSAVIDDIKKDLSSAHKAVLKLPASARQATKLSSKYYTALLSILEYTPIDTIKLKRMNVPAFHKTWLLLSTIAGPNHE